MLDLYKFVKKWDNIGSLNAHILHTEALVYFDKHIIFLKVILLF